MQPTDDSALLRQYAESHSDDAFATLVTRHVNLVYSVALRHIGDPHDAEEITQAVFTILAKKALQLRHDRALSSWLFQATRLTANNFVQSKVRRQQREQEAYMQSVFNESGSDVWQQIAPMLDGAVAALAQKDRRAIMLRFYEGRNLGEVGSALGINEEAARKRVNRALEKLRLFFARHGVNSTAATLAATISVNSVHAAPAALANTVTAVAVAKGTAASTSTLTLIKGVMKIMAWTKATTAIGAGVAIILLVSATTVVSVELARAHHPAYESARALTWVEGNLTIDIQADGAVFLSPTFELTNGTGLTAGGDFPFAGFKTVFRITDESGQPVKYARQPDGQYLMTLPRPVPPGGHFGCTIEGSTSDFANHDQSGVYVGGCSYYSEAWRLPAGAQLLDKERPLVETTNAGQIELRLDKSVPPQKALFHFRLPAKSK